MCGLPCLSQCSTLLSNLLIILLGDANCEHLHYSAFGPGPACLNWNQPSHWASLQSISMFRIQNNLSSKYRQHFVIIFSAVSPSWKDTNKSIAWANLLEEGSLSAWPASQIWGGKHVCFTTWFGGWQAPPPKHRRQGSKSKGAKGDRRTTMTNQPVCLLLK